MKELSPIDKLDTVLTFLYDNYSKYRFTLPVLATQLIKEFPQLDLWGELVSILNKLEKDEFVEFDDRDDPNRVYRITFEGKLFKQLGGYKEKDKIEKAKNLRMNLQNFAIALGTSVAGAYYLLEIIKFVVKHFYHGCSPC